MKFKRVLLLTIIISIFLSTTYILMYKKDSIKKIPKGKFITQMYSPSKEYKINLYLAGGGATVDYAVRGELVNKLGLKKNIYWEYHQNETNVRWIDDAKVVINGKVINIKIETYDWRKRS